MINKVIVLGSCAYTYIYTVTCPILPKGKPERSPVANKERD